MVAVEGIPVEVLKGPEPRTETEEGEEIAITVQLSKAPSEAVEWTKVKLSKTEPQRPYMSGMRSVRNGREFRSCPQSRSEPKLGG